MDPRLIQQQSQKLIMSPQMRQFLRLLQLPLAQLLQTVETELSENPVLEEVSSDLDNDSPTELESENASPETGGTWCRPGGCRRHHLPR